MNEESVLWDLIWFLSIKIVLRFEWDVIEKERDVSGVTVTYVSGMDVNE
jgi:hypothetical protein